jgi:hypothetical protein
MFFIIWRGMGYLVAIIVFGCSLIANIVFNKTVGPGYYSHHKWPVALSLILSAAICWLLGNKLRKRPDRIVIDKKTGKEFALNQSRHELFFIPVYWWAPILLIWGLILLAKEFLH